MTIDKIIELFDKRPNFQDLRRYLVEYILNHERYSNVVKTEKQADYIVTFALQYSANDIRGFIYNVLDVCDLLVLLYNK